MGILQNTLMSLFKGKGHDKAVAPFQQTANIAPQENYAGYTQLPNLVMGSQGDYVPDPNRLHAPFQTERETRVLINNLGIHRYDAGDETIIEIPDQDLQRYFNQGKEIACIPQYVPAHGVFVPQAMYQKGYMQALVPSFGQRSIISGATPAVLLSHPINVRTIEEPPVKRASLAGAHAHAPKKGG